MKIGNIHGNRRLAAADADFIIDPVNGIGTDGQNGGDDEGQEVAGVVGGLVEILGIMLVRVLPGTS